MTVTTSLHRNRETQQVDAPQVLFIEDDRVLRSLVEAGLKKLNYRVTVASDGYEAQQLVLRYGSKWDVIVTDIRMPTMDGLEFISWFREFQSDQSTPILACTADNTASKPAREAGANGVHLKPIQWKEFVRQIQFQVCGVA